jgi:hypothetical protein
MVNISVSGGDRFNGNVNGLFHGFAHCDEYAPYYYYQYNDDDQADY